MPSINRTTSNSSDYKALVTLLDADLKIRDGAEHEFFAQYNKSDMIKHVVVCFENEIAIGCGAFKYFDDATVEIKRMFVLPHLRGQGIAKIILAELEQWAIELNFKYCILETGYKQPEAIALYKRSGFNVIPNYGQYKYVASSVCMIKEI